MTAGMTGSMGVLADPGAVRTPATGETTMIGVEARWKAGGRGMRIAMTIV
jgi:hypothetical protein